MKIFSYYCGMEPKKRGRKAISKTEKSSTRGVRLLPSQWEKLLQLGGSKWIRERINRAKTPEAKSS